MRYVLSVLVLLAFVAGLLLQATPSHLQENTFTRQQMLANIADTIILPLHLEFVDQSVAFQEAAYRFRDDPSLENLSQLQQEWRSTSQLWEKVALFQLGQRMFVYHSQIDNGTLSVEAVEEKLSGDEPIDVASVGGGGSNTKGLRTIEYLLFDGAQDNEVILSRYTTDSRADRRMQYLVAAIDALNLTVLDIWNIWSPEGQDYVAEFIEADDGSSIQESISMLANMMLSLLEHIVQMNIGITLGGNLGVVDPAFVISPYGGYSLEQMSSGLEMLQQTFNGDGIDGNQIGFDDYLNFLNATYEDRLLSDAINEQLSLFLDMLSNLDHDALIEEPALIQPVYGEGVRLLVLMKVDMAAWMGVTITFNDNDGD